MKPGATTWPVASIVTLPRMRSAAMAATVAPTMPTSITASIPVSGSMTRPPVITRSYVGGGAEDGGRAGGAPWAPAGAAARWRVRRPVPTRAPARQGAEGDGAAGAERAGEEEPAGEDRRPVPGRPVRGHVRTVRLSRGS
jgi:hypothetical protein